MRYLGVKLAACCFLFLSLFPLYATETFTMAFAHKPADDPQYKFYEKIYSEAFNELGYKFEYKIFPSKRASKLANQGLVDGEPQRIYDYASRQANLVRVEEPIFTNRTLVFSLKSNINIDDLESLKDKAYRVDYLRGSVWSRNSLTKFISSSNLVAVEDNEQGFKRVLLNRTDLFVALEVLALKTLEDDQFKNSNILKVGVLGSNYSYPYLHKSHATLAIKLAEVIKQMKIDGRYEKIYKESMPFMMTK